MSHRYITIKSDGDFFKAKKFMKRANDASKFENIRTIMNQCIQALKKATPEDTGKTADSWEYSIKNTDYGYDVEVRNSNIQNGICIALLLEYGHATGNGGWVEGQHYMRPVLTKYYNKILQDTWERITSL